MRRFPHMSRVTRCISLEQLWNKETGYDLEFRQHERPALRNSRHALCDVVDIHSGVRREPREDEAGCCRGRDPLRLCPFVMKVRNQVSGVTEFSLSD
jgi:hypothetical protein